jgi:hypothetical protein
MTQPEKHEKIEQPEKLGLPPMPFFYHLDQVAVFLNQTVEDLCETRIFFAGRSIGKPTIMQLRAVNIAVDPDDTPDWRITQGELIRWLKVLGIRVYSRGRVV